jgi:hypothetical protein
MALKTMRSAPVGLSDPLEHRPPTPEPGCATCAVLQRRINNASDPHSDGYDPSKATDLRVAMSRHKADEVTS